MAEDTCSVPSCGGPLIARGYCSRCYNRAKRRGEFPGGPQRRPAGSGHLTPRGYVILHRPEHPLANRYGTVAEHRAVLYDAIGPGEHSCHWCGVPVGWTVDLTVDHLDWDRTNNAAANLVPSCTHCNSARAKVKKGGEKWHTAKLTEDQVRAILADASPQSVIAARFGIAKATVSHIKTGRTWAAIFSETRNAR